VSKLDDLGQPWLIRSTRTFVKVLWVGCLVLVPVAFGMIGLTFLKEAEWFTSGPFGISLYGGAEVTAANLRLAAIGAAVGILFLVPMLRALLQIIDSALIGDPFVPENARRLRLIGKLLLGWNIFTPLMAAVVAARFAEGTLVVRTPPFSLSGLLTVVLIFVLAQIFERGSNMRTEIQETV
jgi:hypothetical protein